MGSAFSTATVPQTDQETEANALLDATEVRSRDNQTAVYGSMRAKPLGGLAFGPPQYAVKIDVLKPVRVPGWGYGYVTHTFRGLPVDTDRATALWETPNFQDNAVYFIVKLRWPERQEIWIKASAARPIRKSQMVVSVKLQSEASDSFIDTTFSLPPDTLVTNVSDDVVLMSDLQPVDQAAINYTYALRVRRG